MIYTCTLNPSLDYYMEFDRPLKPSETNRSMLEYYEAGGKGINISIVLSNLQIPSRALGFLGGFTKDYYITLLQKFEYLQPNFTYVDGNTRINVKLHDTYNTDLNASGPYITADNMKNLTDKVLRLGEGDYLALAGVCQDYLLKNVVDMLKQAIDEDVRVVLDTNADILREVISLRPFLVKTTSPELADYLGRTIASREDAVACARELAAQGAENVLVLHDSSVAVLVSGGDTYTCDLLHDEPPVNTVGVGDSLTAGFLMNYIRSLDAVDSFRFACCCASATAYSKGLATTEKVDSFYETTVITKTDAEGENG